MIQVVHDGAKASYECRIFYKEPRPVGGIEQVSVGAVLETMLELRSDPDPIIRLTSFQSDGLWRARRILGRYKK